MVINSKAVKQVEVRKFYTGEIIEVIVKVDGMPWMRSVKFDYASMDDVLAFVASAYPNASAKVIDNTVRA